MASFFIKVFKHVRYNCITVFFRMDSSSLKMTPKRGYIRKQVALGIRFFSLIVHVYMHSLVDLSFTNMSISD